MSSLKRVNHHSLLLELSLLLLCLQSVLGWRWSDLLRFTREDFDADLDNVSNETNSTTTTIYSTTTDPITTTGAPPIPILTTDAIVNIVASVLAVIFLTTVLCYLMITFNQAEHRTRVRTALERNKQIDRQIAASRARQQQKQALQQEQHTRDQDVLKVETVAVGVVEESRSLKTPVHATELEPEGELASGEHEAHVIHQERMAAVELEGPKDSPKVSAEKEERAGGGSDKIVVDFGDKTSGTSSTEDDDRPLISVTNSDSVMQPVLLVQPAQPEEVV